MYFKLQIWVTIKIWIFQMFENFNNSCTRYWVLRFLFRPIDGTIFDIPPSWLMRVNNFETSLNFPVNSTPTKLNLLVMQNKITSIDIKNYG